MLSPLCYVSAQTVANYYKAVASQSVLMLIPFSPTPRRIEGSKRRTHGIGSSSSPSGTASSAATFTFDRVFWSMYAGANGQEEKGSFGRDSAPYAAQKCVFEGVARYSSARTRTAGDLAAVVTLHITI